MGQRSLFLRQCRFASADREHEPDRRSHYSTRSDHRRSSRFASPGRGTDPARPINTTFPGFWCRQAPSSRFWAADTTRVAHERVLVGALGSGGASAAMSLLRRPHDHRRDLRARRRTPRPAIARCRGRDRNVMTTITASSHRPPAGTCRARRRTTVAPVPAKADAVPPIVAQLHRRVQRRRPILDDGRLSTPLRRRPAQPSLTPLPIKSL
jgi:hypothetical protein